MSKDLAARAQQAADERESRPWLASVKAEKGSLERKIIDRHARFSDAIGLDADQFVRDAVTAVQLNSRLQECTISSVFGALMTAAQLRLRVGVLGHCWILPFLNHEEKRWDASFVLGYQGLVELGDRAGVRFSARAVCEHDHFELEYGTANERLVHRPALTGERGDVYGYYATARSVDRLPEFHYMAHAEVVAHRQRHARLTPAWRNNFDVMAAKTVLKQLGKFLPKSSLGDLAVGMSADEGVRHDDTPTISAAETTVPLLLDDSGENPDDEPPAEPATGAENDTSDSVHAEGHEHTSEPADDKAPAAATHTQTRTTRKKGTKS